MNSEHELFGDTGHVLDPFLLTLTLSAFFEQEDRLKKNIFDTAYRKIWLPMLLVSLLILWMHPQVTYADDVEIHVDPGTLINAACNPAQLDFEITNVDETTAPGTIWVSWDDDTVQIAIVGVDQDGVATYSVIDPELLDGTLQDSWTSIYAEWSGQFVVSDCLETPTPTLTFTATATPSETITPFDTPTNTATFTPTATDTATATNTVTVTATPSETITPFDTPTDTATFTPTATDTLVATFTPSLEPIDTATFTPTFTPNAAEQTPTSTETPILLDTPTSSPTLHPTPTFTPEATRTTPTPSSTVELTVTPVSSSTPVFTATATVTVTTNQELFLPIIEVNS